MTGHNLAKRDTVKEKPKREGMQISLSVGSSKQHYQGYYDKQVVK